MTDVCTSDVLEARIGLPQPGSHPVITIYLITQFRLPHLLSPPFLSCTLVEWTHQGLSPAAYEIFQHGQLLLVVSYLSAAPNDLEGLSALDTQACFT
jgi:hypothetical protein